MVATGSTSSEKEPFVGEVPRPRRRRRRGGEPQPVGCGQPRGRRLGRQGSAAFVDGVDLLGDGELEVQQPDPSNRLVRFPHLWRRMTGVGLQWVPGLDAATDFDLAGRFAGPGRTPAGGFSGALWRLEDEDQCHFVQWCDEEWPERAQRYLVELWKVVATFQRMEAEARREMRLAVQQKEEQLRRNRAEVEQAKTIAQRACLFYETRANSEADEKRRAWMIAAILGGMLVAMVFALVVRKK
ncbi:hypothetical protein ACP70R_012868 [Stipagrostis hirtigluma subsp. patula]